MAWRPFTICGDSHGDMIDIKARKAFLDFCDAYRPDIRIHLGDAIDFRGWRKGASPEDKAESMQRDYDMGMQFLRDMGATVWLWGNHDKRVLDVATSANGSMRDYAGKIATDMHDTAKQIGCKVVPWGVRKGVYELGKVRAGGYRVIHGYRHGIHALVAEVKTYGRVIHGHIHCRGSFVGSTYDATEGHTIPCLCRLDMDYAAGNETGLRQEHGWAYGVVNDRTGAVVFQHARKIGRDWITPSEFGVL